MAATRHNLSSRWWGTFNQWRQMGGKVMRRPSHVPQGKWGTSIVFWAPIVKTVENENGEEEEDRFFFMRTYTVFNVDQVEGLDHLRAGHADTGESVVDYRPAEEAVDASLLGMGLGLRYGGASPCLTHPPPPRPARRDQLPVFSGSAHGWSPPSVVTIDTDVHRFYRVNWPCTCDIES